MTRRNLKLTCIAVASCIVLALLLFGAVSGRTSFGAASMARVEHFLDSISHAGVGGFLAVLGLLVLIAFTGFLPASLIGIVCGSLYGLFEGFVVSTVATLLGAWVSFLVSHSFFKDAFERVFARHAGFHRFGGEVVKGGWRFVCLLRMSPIMPFALTSYALGLSNIDARAYMVGTIASLPALFGYVCMGWLARHSVNAQSTEAGYLQWIIFGLGVGATVFLTVYLKRVISRTILADRQVAD